jgi:hypothetical protein
MIKEQQEKASHALQTYAHAKGQETYRTQNAWHEIAVDKKEEAPDRYNKRCIMRVDVDKEIIITLLCTRLSARIVMCCNKHKPFNGNR